MDISFLAPYSSAIATLAVVTLIMLVQLLIADVTGIAKRHVPGGFVKPDHSEILFRTTRVVANTNESIAIYLCALLFCIFSNANPDYTAYCAWAYAITRLLYAICYYANIATARSIVFGLSLITLIAMLLVGTFS